MLGRVVGSTMPSHTGHIVPSSFCIPKLSRERVLLGLTMADCMPRFHQNSPCSHLLPESSIPALPYPCPLKKSPGLKTSDGQPSLRHKAGWNVPMQRLFHNENHTQVTLCDSIWLWGHRTWRASFAQESYGQASSWVICIDTKAPPTLQVTPLPLSWASSGVR